MWYLVYTLQTVIWGRSRPKRGHWLHWFVDTRLGTKPKSKHSFSHWALPYMCWVTPAMVLLLFFSFLCTTLNKLLELWEETSHRQVKQSKITKECCEKLPRLCCVCNAWFPKEDWFLSGHVHTDASKMQEIRSEGSCKVTSEFLEAFDLAIWMVIELYNVLEKLVDC